MWHDMNLISYSPKSHWNYKINFAKWAWGASQELLLLLLQLCNINAVYWYQLVLNLQSLTKKTRSRVGTRKKKVPCITKIVTPYVNSNYTYSIPYMYVKPDTSFAFVNSKTCYTCLCIPGWNKALPREFVSCFHRTRYIHSNHDQTIYIYTYI